MSQAIKFLKSSLLSSLPAFFLVAVVIFACGPAETARAQAHEIYPAPEQAGLDLTAGLKAAAAQHKRIILDFGGNWCGDCQVLDIYFHDPANKPILDANFIVVHVNIGHMDQNQNIAERYQVPLAKGVPALAVLDEHGKLLYSQRTGEFEAMRHMDPSSVTNFLLQWKPAKSGI